VRRLSCAGDKTKQTRALSYLLSSLVHKRRTALDLVAVVGLSNSSQEPQEPPSQGMQAPLGKVCVQGPAGSSP
jgi:hypothetical protein